MQDHHHRSSRPSSPRSVVRRLIREAGFHIFDRRDLPDKLGVQYILLGGGNVNVYRTGTVVVQGTLSPEERATLIAVLRAA